MSKNYLLSTVVALSLCTSMLDATVFVPLPTDISESSTIYNQGDANLLRVDVKTVITEGICDEEDYSGCTLEDVNSDIDKRDDFEPEIKVHFSSSDFPDDGQVSNATLRLRGGASRKEKLKSYRIKLDSKKELWRGERKLQLNKHLCDLTRIKNKLSFDLMQTIPNLPSLRTQFVHLYLDTQDYGLYTHVENVGKEYLLRRGYDKNSNIYKAYHFDFTLSPKIAIDKKGKPLNQEDFDYVLEQKRGKNSKKLHEMLTAVNNHNNDFKKDVLEKYFNLNNFLTWEAVNILMGNTDVATSNFYIFNPKGKDTFYFLPWDYDSTWGYDWHPTIVEGHWTPAKRYQGPHNLWATEFGKRFLMEKGSLELLKNAVKEIKENYLTPDKVKALTDSYYSLVYPRITTDPDSSELDSNQPTDELVFAEYNKIYTELSDTVEINYQRFLKELNSPMPFHIAKPHLEGENILFNWEKAVDLQGNAITYDLEVADSFRFEPESIKITVKDLDTNSFSTKWVLPDGEYYYRVIARDVSNPTEYWQGAFEEEYDKPSDYTAYGVTDFTIEKETKVEE